MGERNTIVSAYTCIGTYNSISLTHWYNIGKFSPNQNILGKWVGEDRDDGEGGREARER